MLRYVERDSITRLPCQELRDSETNAGNGSAPRSPKDERRAKVNNEGNRAASRAHGQSVFSQL